MNDGNGIPGTDEERRRFLAYVLAGGTAVALAACAQDTVDHDEVTAEGLHNPLLWALAWKQTSATNLVATSFLHRLSIIAG